MDRMIETLLERNLRDVFGERDQSRRRAAIPALFTEDALFVDHNGEARGHEALDRAVIGLQAAFPGFSFTPIGEAQAVAGSGRLAWGHGPKEDPQRVTGLDVIVLKGSLIGALYTFIDPAPRADAS